MQEATPIIIKKVKKGGHGHHGGAWKVAYADFVTAMMAFFLVMWILGMSDETKEAVAAYFRDPHGFRVAPALSRASIGHSPETLLMLRQDREPAGDGETRRYEAAAGEVSQAAEEAIREAVQAAGGSEAEYQALMDGVEIRVSEEGLLIELVESRAQGELFFDLGSARIRPAGQALLRKVAPILQELGRPLMIDGHTDAHPYRGSGYDNFDLSSDRAHAVRRLLIGNGLHAERIASVRGFAATRPRLSDPYHFANRRVSLLVPFAAQRAAALEMPAEGLRESIDGRFRLPQP